MNAQEKRLNDFVAEIEVMFSSLKESIADAETIPSKWNAVDAFMVDIEKLQLSQPMTGRKTFRGLLDGENAEGNTKYIAHMSSMPILVNTIRNEDGSLSPSKVCEMHIGNVDGRLCLLITPTIISV